MLLYNAFDLKNVVRFEMPKDITVVLSSFISLSYELFIICETASQHVQIFTVDLESKTLTL